MQKHLKRKRESHESQVHVTKPVSVSDLPRVLLAKCLSHLTGKDRQHASLVCKMWCVVEKDRDAWPNNISLVGSYLMPSSLKRLTPRLARKRFDTLQLLSESNFGTIDDIACSTLLKDIKVKHLTLRGSSSLSFLHHMTFGTEIQSIECNSNVINIHSPPPCRCLSAKEMV